jgi:hypothetical protein
MNCKQAKTQVALMIGNDLEPRALEDVRTHLGQCVGCRQHFEQLSSALEVLQAPPRSWNPEHESLWPKLSTRLASSTAGQKPHRLSGWAPTLAVAAACLAMFWVVSSQWPADGPSQPDGVFRAQPVGEAPAFVAPRTNRNGSEGHVPRFRGAPARNDQSGSESDTMRSQGRNSAAIPAIPVVPVAEPAH